MNAWLGIGLVLAVLGVLMLGLRVYQRRCRPHPEWVRKLLHVGMGLVTLSFPWLFAESWPVFALAALAVAALLAVRLVRVLRSSIGNVLGGVGRASLGEVYFPLGVALVFFLSLREPDEPPGRRVVLYMVPVLCLTLADALAALVGIRFGRSHYPTVDGRKSYEGSLAFFGVALCATYFLLLGWREAKHPEIVLIAFLLALLAMMFEAIAWGGLDNLILPLAAFLLLKSYLALPLDDLMLRLAVTALLGGIVLAYRSQTTLAGSALSGALLVGYLSVVLGGWQWLVAPLLFFLSYTLTARWASANHQRVHNVHAVLCVSSGGLLWLFLSRLLDRPELLFPFTLAFAGHFGIIVVARACRARIGLSVPVVLLVGIAAGWLLTLPWLCLETSGTRTILYGGIALLAVTLATLGFAGTQPGLDDCPTDTPRWLRQATWAGAASALGLLALLR